MKHVYNNLTSREQIKAQMRELLVASAAVRYGMKGTTTRPSHITSVSTGNNCRAPDGTIIPAGQTVNISSTTICTCPNSGFLMSNQAVCAIAPPDVTVMAHIAD